MNAILLKLFVFSVVKSRKAKKKSENSDQKVIGPLSQGRAPFKLSVRIVKGDVFEDHPGLKNC